MQEIAGIRDENGDAVSTVFGLCKEIRCDPGGIRRSVCEDEDFRGAWKQINRDGTEHLAFGLHDVGIARSKDLLHRRNRRRPIGHGRDRLSSAEFPNFRGPGRAQGVEHRGIDRAPFPGRRADDDGRTTCRFGDADRHVHGRYEGRRPTGDVDPHSLEGLEHFPDFSALRVGRVPIPTFAPLREHGDVLQTGADRRTDGVIDRPLGSVELLFRYSEAGRVWKGDTVELCGQLQQCGITPGAHRLKHFGHGVGDMGGGLVATLKPIEPVGGGENLHGKMERSSGRP